jgi:hypothetical protein
MAEKIPQEAYGNSPGTGSTQPRPDTVLNVKFCVFSYSRTKDENFPITVPKKKISPNNRTKEEK